MISPPQSSIRTINGAELLVSGLEARGVRVVAGMPGGAILPLYDAIYKSKLRHVLARHEQGAGFIAQGQARATGRVAVCLATSGPGATNLLTALADARADSIPIIAITGQVPRALIGTDAFQEADIVAMARPATRAAFQIRDAREIPALLERAFRIARGPRPGPVLIDVPKDVQLQALDPDEACRPLAIDAGDVVFPAESAARPDPALFRATIEQMALALEYAQRPMLYLGGGVIHSGASARLRRFALRQDLPVVASLMGLGAFDGTHPLFYGMLGMHAARYTNLALEECDLLLAIGARFDDRAAGRAAEFCPGAKVLHIDIDAGEIGKLRAVDIGLNCDARRALGALDRALAPRRRSAWQARLRELRARYSLEADNQLVRPEQGPVKPEVRTGRAIAFLRMLRAELRPTDVITTDVGQHQMWVAQWLPIRAPRGLLTSGGLGTMGFGLPAAIGAALERPRDRVICITGDGSFLLNLQEMATLREIHAGVKIVLLNNRSLGMVRQQQALFFRERYSSCDLPIAPDFPALAAAFGVPAVVLDGIGPETADAETDVARRLGDFLNAPGPGLLEVRIGADERVLPMVPPGRPNREMLGPA